MAKSPISVADAVAKWKKNTAGATQYYQSGVQRATGWSEGALAASARRDAGLQQAIADGRINAGIQRTGDAGWKSATLGKGVQNWSTATQAAGDRMTAGLTKTYNMLQQAAAATSGIDTSTIEGRLEKARQHALAMHNAAVQMKTGR